MNNFSSERRWGNMVIRALATATELSEEQLLNQAGLSHTKWHSPARIPQEYFRALWLTSEELTGRKDLGLLVAQNIELGDVGIVGYEMLSASDPESALESFARHGQLISDVLQFDTERVSNYLKISATTSHPDAPITHHAFDLAVYASATLLKGPISGGKMKVEEAHFPHNGFGLQLYYESTLGCTCKFNKKGAALVFQLVDLHHPLPAANPELHAELRAKLDELAQIDTPWTRAISSKINEHISRGLPYNRLHIASALGVSERSLLRRLEAEGVSYKQVSNDCILRLAVHYLTNGWSAKQIAPALGFADSASLGRAIKRLTGKTLKQMRESGGHQ